MPQPIIQTYRAPLVVRKRREVFVPDRPQSVLVTRTVFRAVHIDIHQGWERSTEELRDCVHIQAIKLFLRRAEPAVQRSMGRIGPG